MNFSLGRVILIVSILSMGTACTTCTNCSSSHDDDIRVEPSCPPVPPTPQPICMQEEFCCNGVCEIIEVQPNSQSQPQPESSCGCKSVFVFEELDDPNGYLDLLAGQQYAYIVGFNQLTDQRFGRRMFDAVRHLLNSPCSISMDVELWSSFGGGLTHVKGDRNDRGYHANNVDVSIGAHTKISQFLFGIAADYEKDNVDFKHGGHNVWHTGQGAFYGAYQSQCFYIYSDLILGGSFSKFNRPLEFEGIERKAKSTPKCGHGRLYGEFGWNFMPCGLLLQPYFGFDGNYTKFKGIHENGASSLNLTVNSKSVAGWDTYLGVHFTAAIVEYVKANIDLAWQHRFTNSHSLTASLSGLGQSFNFKSFDYGLNGFQGALNLNAEVSENVELYGEVVGEFWDNWNSAEFNAGLNLWF